MLNIKKNESKNQCYISGILSELEITEGTTGDGREYVRGTAKIRVDQEIDGKAVENIIPIGMFSMKLKKDGTKNSNYDRIVGYKDSLISIAAAEDVSQASKITVAGKSCNITENAWVDKTTNNVRTGFQISSNFLNAQKKDDDEKATFELSGVVIGKMEEMQNDEPTGRIIVNLGVVGYNGRIDKIDLVAANAAKEHIEANWDKGDTVVVGGIINVSQTVKRYKEEQGFGDPIERVQTITKRELLITSGSASGLEESLSYDADDIKAALAERKARHEEMQKNASKAGSSVKKDDGFGF